MAIRPIRYPEIDIHQYGFESALVVDDPTMVDVLVNNDFHAKTGIPIFSACGHPKHLQSIFKSTVQLNPKIKHYFIHGTKQNPELMTKTMAKWGYFPTNIVDLGFSTLGVMSVPMLKDLLSNSQKHFPLSALPPTMLESTLLSSIRENRPLDEICQRMEKHPRAAILIAEVQEVE